ncbi:MAG TPA: efflux RND transporter periplasmic adaptor subunit [Planctomycetota bacterium]|nr:efflux RND transporter periplasmic adaptor subunit [Planctomycetota bacterium]HRR78918.1 efflux RND transporter periplasmic adaptor subunit [Planctomycetota bacterium]HRT92804.1 efflux RND transporter periplasmic adaptor subunit [Planctomycetota bacterium]
MKKLLAALSHAGWALFVFTALTGLFLWRTGSLQIRLTGAPAAADPGASHAHGDACEHDAPEPGAHKHGAGCAHDEPKKADAHEHGEACAHEGEADWCAEHKVPESACTRCNPGLIAKFKEKGDWCDGHNLPESQCVKCNPDAAAKLKPPPAVAAAAAQARCEHGVAKIDCDNCRFEVGAVKVRPDVAKALLKPARVQHQELATTMRLTGQVQLDETRVVDVAPPAPGRVVRVQAVLGQAVSEGDVLAIVHSAEFGVAKAGYLDAWTKLELARREQERQAALSGALEKALEHLATDHGVPGKCDPLRGNCLPQAPLGEWRAKLLGAAAKLRLAHSVYGREKALLDKQASSRAEFEQAEHELHAAQVEYTALVDEAQLGLHLEKLRADNAARQAEIALTAAEQQLHIFGLDDAAVAALRTEKENGGFAHLAVRAPRAGTILTRAAAEGKFVEAKESLFALGDLSNVWVWCNVYERDLGPLHAALAEGQPPHACVRVAAFGDEPFCGVIDLIGSIVDEKTRTVRVRVQVDNAQGKLKPGMFANVEIQFASGKQAAFVPREAVLADEGRQFVFQEMQDGLWLRRDVATGRTQGRLVEIVSGLDPDATVAAGGAFMLKSDILRSKMGAG